MRSTFSWAAHQASPSCVVATHGASRLNSEAQELVGTIERVQSALAANDRARLDELLCHDFHAFENGVHMSGQELLEVMSKYHAAGKRYKWSVTSPQVEVQGNLGVVIYENHGFIVEARDAKPVAQSWLESVVLRRQGSAWRLAFLHSNRTARAAKSAP